MEQNKDPLAELKTPFSETKNNPVADQKVAFFELKKDSLSVPKEVKENSKAVLPGHFPRWLHRKLPAGGSLMATRQDLALSSLHTVCEEARCPNLLECYAKRCATFLTMGKGCTRACPFCSIDFSKKPEPLDESEPEKIASMVSRLGLCHAVITMVTRDDLSDGGASFLVKIVRAIREKNRKTTVELLTSDFQGDLKALKVVLDCEPEIFNHNIETVRSITSRVRHKATYDRSLSLLQFGKSYGKKLLVKSGFMVGLGESMEEIKETIQDLHAAGCDIITIGQYLQPEKSSLKVVEFLPLEKFEEARSFGEKIGVPFIFAKPFVRSSYNAAMLFNKLREKRS